MALKTYKTLIILHKINPNQALFNQKIDTDCMPETDDTLKASSSIGGFKGEVGEALPPQIFLTLKFVVCIALKIIEMLPPDVIF